MTRNWGTITFFAAVTLLISILLVALRYSTQKDHVNGIPPNGYQEGTEEERPVNYYKQYKPTHPHIVFILADDLGYNDVGYHAINGMSAVRTPHLDALAADGVKLENYYVQPICSPSRSVLMTGRYLIRYGLQHRVFMAAQPTCLPLSETILPQKLKEHGYATHAIGKWHLGMCRTECLPTRRGFDSFFGYICGGMDHYSHTRTYVYKVKSDHNTVSNSTIQNTSIAMEDVEPEDDDSGEYEDPDVIERDVWSGKDLWQNETVEWGYEGVYSNQLFTEKAQDVINKHNPNKPMFLYLAYKNVHRPLQAPDKYMEVFKHVKEKERRILAAMAYALDEGVKNVTDTLKINGMWDNTVLVFSSDNGGMLKKNAGGNNWPLKGGKWSLWEGGIRAVGFVNSPLLPYKVKGTVNRQLIHISDWLPTFVDGIAGGNSTNMRKPLDGFNQWPMISKGQASPRKEILHNIDPIEPYPKISGEERRYWITHLTNESINPLVHAAIRWGDWKLITGATAYAYWQPPPESGFHRQSVRNESAHCVQRHGRGAIVRLYNIKKDPSETCNLARNLDYLQIVKNLLKRLREYADQSVPVYYPEEDPNANPALRGGAWKPWLNDDFQTYANIYPFKGQPYM